ncbi:flagellar motor protein MotD [Halioxenophilus sp. WMMB6]|uniref:flagellar motor protein MotD n=1 Tax=Halioxenophilus sp. WMMB6 TaxID=3073815 RepID=UPI00295E33F7|nr:flagellar motor protein MotD [Halioxenophilus sp. WMMB6]
MISSRRPPQLSINHERWLVSYADFITLLFAFFVVMYSVSQVNEDKFRVLSDALLDVFHDPKRSLAPIQVGDPSLSTETTPIDTQAVTPDKTQPGDGAFAEISDLPSANSEVAAGADVDADAEAHFNDIEQTLENRFANLLSEQKMVLNQNELWLEIEMNAKLLFGPGSAEPSYAAETVFDQLAKILTPYDNAIEVEGFTDNQPINTPAYPSNWELSTARASTVVQILQEGGVAPARLAAIGYGQYKPIADNSTAAGREHNRRVVVKVAKPKYQAMLEQDRAYRFFQQQKQSILTNDSLSATEKNSQLVALGGAPTNPSLRSALSDAAELQPIERSATAPPNNRQDDALTLEPVYLEDGNILYTNDPQLPRNRPE